MTFQLGGYWRDQAAKVISEVIAANADKGEKAVSVALFAAYPFGERKFYPYKVWLDEIRRQRGLKKYVGPCACGHGKASHRGWCHAADCNCKRFVEGNPAQTGLSL